MSPVVQKLPSHVFALKLLTSQNEKKTWKRGSRFKNIYFFRTEELDRQHCQITVYIGEIMIFKAIVISCSKFYH